MFAATRRWFRRNRTPLAVVAGVAGAGYVATQYVLSRLNDARERMGSDRIAKENLRRRFEQNQEDCTFTVLALLPTATANILEAMDTERITYEIQTMKASKQPTGVPPSIAETNLTDDDGKSLASAQSESGVHASQVALPPPGAQDGPQDGGAQQGSRKTKRQLWDDLTISSISRAFTLIYTLGLLTMLTRVQLNLLGRRSYLSSVVSLATGSAQATISLQDNDEISPDQVYTSDFEMNRRYLTFSWWLLNRGWADLMHRVEAAVRQVFGHLSPRDTLSFDAFSELTLEVRKIVEGATPEERRGARWLEFVLPPRDMEDHVIRESGVIEPGAAGTAVSPPLRRLLDETADIVESPSFAHVLTLLLDAGFSFLVDQNLAAAAFDQSAATTTATTGTTESRIAPTKAILLPRILSVLTRQAHVIGNGMPNEYLREMEQVATLEAFAAVVYSSNWESEISEKGLSAGQEGPQSGDAEAPAATAVEQSVVMVDAESPVKEEPVEQSVVMVGRHAPETEAVEEGAVTVGQQALETKTVEQSVVMVDDEAPVAEAAEPSSVVLDSEAEASLQNAWEKAVAKTN